MPGPLTNIKVVELAVWFAGPAIGGILSDWGANVVKIEPLIGDPLRGLSYAGETRELSSGFELDNRGKRSMAIDLSKPEGRELGYELISTADVFFSNIRYSGLERLGFDYNSLSSINQDLIYGHVSGFGLESVDSDRPTFDVGAFWARSGFAALLKQGDGSPTTPRGAMGDHATGANMAGGIVAALFARERGLSRGQFVSTSLTRTAAYQLGQDMNQAIRTGVTPRMVPRVDQRNPLMNPYKTSDARWIWLLMLESDRFWDRFVDIIAAPELAKDDRFQSSLTRAANCSALTALLDEILARQSFSDWIEVFDANDIWWAPVQEVDDVLRDSAFFDAGCVVAVPDGSGGTVDMVASPIDFSVSNWAPAAPAPQLGAHTELILSDDLGVNWDRISELKSKGVIL